MIEWILKQKSDRLVYMFYAPWVLIFLYPLTPFYGNTHYVLIPVILIFWIQFLLYIFFNLIVCKRLIILNNNRFADLTLLNFRIHSWLNFSFITVIVFDLITKKLLIEKDSIFHLFLTIFVISELYRYVLISKLITGLEFKRKSKFKEYVLTLYLVMNPILGLWNLNERIKKIIISD